MSHLRLATRIATWFRTVLHRRRFENDMDAEFQFHLQEHTNALVAKGMASSEARRQARIAFGGSESSRHSVRSVIGLGLLDEVVADLRYAWRVLRNSPGFTAIAACSLALAIGANTTIFSLAHFMLFQRLDVPRATELRMLFRDEGKHSIFHMSWGGSFPAGAGLDREDSFTYPIYQQMRHEAQKAGLAIAGFKELHDVNCSFDNNAQALQLELVSGNFYQQLETVPALGRGIQPTDDGAPGTGEVAVLSHGFWQRSFAGSPDVLGKVIRVGTVPVTIVGVNAKGFTGAQSVQRSPDLFLPMSMIARLQGTLGKENVLQSTKLSWIQMLMRKPPGVADAQLQARLDSIFHAAALATVTVKAGESISTIALEDGSHGLAENVRFLRQPIYVLLGLVSCVLLLACANVANLMLARANNRQREISVRLALGAGRTRVFRQLFIESLLLASIGGVGGLVLGYLGRAASPAILTNAWDSNAVTVPFSWPVFAFTSGVTLLTGVLFGLAPAWQSTRTDVNTALKAGTRSASRQRKAWTGKGLVAFQVAMATLLVAGSALFVRTMGNLASVHPGFQAEGLVLFEVQPPNLQYPGQKSAVLHHELLERIKAVPGVDGVSAAAVPFVAKSMWNSVLRLEGEPVRREPNGQEIYDHTINLNKVSPDFFSVMQIPMLAGRGFTKADTTTSPQVAVVNHAFAEKLLHGKDPIGQRFTTDTEEVSGTKVPVWLTIVGVCADTQYADLRTEPGPIFFTDRFQSHDPVESAEEATYIVRSRLGVSQLMPSLRRAVLTVDPDLPLNNVRTQTQQIREVTRQERMFATLTAAFGVLALALACVGIYGVMAYTVSQRTHEIGIRLALGAERRKVRGMVLTEAFWLAGAGIVIGTLGALGLARLVKSMLYHLNFYDPLSIGAAITLLLAVALSAGWLPAARAARLEPATALRQD